MGNVGGKWEYAGGQIYENIVYIKNVISSKHDLIAYIKYVYNYLFQLFRVNVISSGS